MPPIITRQRTISGKASAVKAPSGLGQGVGAAVRGFGRAVGDLGAILDRQKAQDSTNKLIGLKSGHRELLRPHTQAEVARQGSDAFGGQERTENKFKELFESQTKGLNPKEKEIYSLWHDNELQNELDASAIREAVGRKLVSSQVREQSLDSNSRNAGDGTSNLDESLEGYQGDVADQRDAGDLSQQAAVDQFIKGSRVIAMAHAKGRMAESPELFLSFEKEGIYDDVIPAKELGELKAEAKKLQKANKDDAESRANEVKKAEQDVLKQKQKETGDVFVAGITEGSLTREQVLQSTLDPTGENSKEHWLKEIEKRAKKVKESIGETWKTDPEVEAGFIQRITEDPESVKDDEITDKLGEGLDNSTAKGLLAFKKKRLGRGRDPVKEQEEKTAIKRLSDAKTSRFFDPADRVNNSRLWAENVNNLQRYIQNHPEQDLGLYVDQILAPVEISFIQNIMDVFTPGQPEKEEATEARQEELRIEAEDPKRIQAEQILTNAGKPVTKKNVDFVMGKL